MLIEMVNKFIEQCYRRGPTTWYTSGIEFSRCVMSCIKLSHEYLDVDVDTSRASATRDVFYVIISSSVLHHP